MADPEGIVEGERTGEDLAGTTAVVPAQAQAALSGRGMLRRGVLRWALSGGMRLTYRAWTRIAARLFPEESAQARLAERIGVPLPDRLNMSWRRLASRGWWTRVRSTATMPPRSRLTGSSCSISQLPTRTRCHWNNSARAPTGSPGSSRAGNACWSTASTA
jgi:hypothetical protein